jgi:hypothetical protein
VIKNTPIWIRTVALTMLLAMVYYFAGYRIVYFMLTKDAKSFASAEIKNKNTRKETLVLSKAEFANAKWTEENKEFSFNGQLYDIISISKTADKYIVLAYADKNETQLVRALNDFVKQLFPADNSKKNKNAESVIVALQNEYLPLNAIKILIPDATQVVYHQQALNGESSCCHLSTWRPPSC